MGIRNGKVIERQELSFVTKEQILNSSDIGLSFDRYTINHFINSYYPVFELKELVEFKRGTSITKKDVIDGNIPVIAGGQTPAYYHNEYNRVGETITVSSSGAYAGFINYFTVPIFASDCFTISPKDKEIISTKFLYHLLKSGTAYKSLRKMLVEKYMIGVISLPSGVFQPYSGVKTSILLLDRELSQKTDKIFFAKVENDGYDLGAQRREIEKNDLPKFQSKINDYFDGIRNGKVIERQELSFVTKEQILNSSDIGLNSKI